MARIPDKQAIFFELEGVLIERPQLAADGTVPFLPGVLDALAQIDTRTFQLFVATNREDIAFGRLRERDFKRLGEKLAADIREHSRVELAKIYHCPYHPKGRAKWRKESVFRKPAPGMYKMAQQEFDLDLSRCWAVCNTTTDLLSGSRAGMGTMLVQTGVAGTDGAYWVEPHREAADLRDAVRQIREFEHALRC